MRKKYGGFSKWAKKVKILFFMKLKILPYDNHLLRWYEGGREELRGESIEKGI